MALNGGKSLPNPTKSRINRGQELKKGAEKEA